MPTPPRKLSRSPAKLPEGPADSLRSFEDSLPMALLRAREAVMRRFRPFLQSFEVTEQQWRVLRALNEVAEIDAIGLARVTFLLPPSLTRILRDLEARGWVRRSVNRSDNRVAVLSLSPAGRRLLTERGRQSERIYQAIASRIGADRLEELMQLLRSVEEDLQDPAPDAPASATQPGPGC